MIDARTLRALEWDRVLALLSLCAATEEGKERASALVPAETEGEVTLRHARVRECREGERLCGHLPLEGYGRCDTRAPSGVSLPLEIFRALRENLRVWTRVRAWLADGTFPKPSLSALFPEVPDLDDLHAFLERLLDARGEVADGASPTLYHIRREREHLRGSLQRTMERLVDSLGDRVLQQTTYTVRSGRLVLPVLANRKSAVKGVLHDTSSTGATIYVEPLEIVEENNRLASLDAEEREEIHRILVEATRSASQASPALESSFDAVEDLDLLLACARLGSRCAGLLPELDGGGAMVLRGARHPLLDRRLGSLRAEAWGEEPGRDAVPLDLSLSLDGVRTLVISGPNAGGKSVSLKTVGLLVAMSQAGIPIPAAEGTRLPIFKTMFASLGDSQSILDSLSTFSARMVHLKEALDGLGEPFLAILDELGAGTDPIEGSALGEATLLHFHARRGFTLCSTHHEPLKARALATEGMGNASMEFSESDLRPTFRLKMGAMGSSRAMEIAQRSGLPASLLEKARELLPSEERRLKDVLEALEGEIAAHEREIEALRLAQVGANGARAALSAERDGFLREKAEWFAAALPERLRRWEEDFLSGLKAEVNLQSVKRRARKETVRLVENAREELEIPARAAAGLTLPSVGDRVKALAFGIEGDVVAVDAGSGKVTVSSGGKSLVVGAGDVAILSKGEARKVLSRGGVHTDLADAQVEINLIGLTVAEAEAELAPFLDRAALAGLPSVRVIHGIGTGRLRAAVRALLKASPYVATFEEAPSNQGGAGATLAGLK